MMSKKVSHTIYHLLGKRRSQLPACLDYVQDWKMEKKLDWKYLYVFVLDYGLYSTDFFCSMNDDLDKNVAYIADKDEVGKQTSQANQILKGNKVVTVLCGQVNSHTFECMLFVHIYHVLGCWYWCR